MARVHAHVDPQTLVHLHMLTTKALASYSGPRACPWLNLREIAYAHTQSLVPSPEFGTARVHDRMTFGYHIPHARDGVPLIPAGTAHT